MLRYMLMALLLVPSWVPQAAAQPQGNWGPCSATAIAPYWDPAYCPTNYELCKVRTHLDASNGNTYWWVVNGGDSTRWDRLEHWLTENPTIDTWVTIAPNEPTGGPAPYYHNWEQWADAIGDLGDDHHNLVGWLIGDFYPDEYPPSLLCNIRQRARDRDTPPLRPEPLLFYVDAYLHNEHGPPAEYACAGGARIPGGPRADIRFQLGALAGCTDAGCCSGSTYSGCLDGIVFWHDELPGGDELNDRIKEMRTFAYGSGYMRLGYRGAAGGGASEGDVVGYQATCTGTVTRIGFSYDDSYPYAGPDPYFEAGIKAGGAVLWTEQVIADEGIVAEKLVTSVPASTPIAFYLRALVNAPSGTAFDSEFFNVQLEGCGTPTWTYVTTAPGLEGNQRTWVWPAGLDIQVGVYLKPISRYPPAVFPTLTYAEQSLEVSRILYQAGYLDGVTAYCVDDWTTTDDYFIRVRDSYASY